jgi:ABC-type uncharacterized transport system auxiliary subunit
MRDSGCSAALLAASLLLGACNLGKPGPEVHYYALSVPLPENAPPAGAPSLMLRRFVARDPFGQEAMVFRSGSYKVSFYGYHRWIAPPANLISDWTLRYLRGAGLFSQVSEYSGDLALTAVIRDFTELDNRDSWAADLSIDFMITRTTDGATVWMQSYSSSQRASRRNPEAVAEAMSQGLSQVLAKLATDLRPVAVAAALPPVAPAPTPTTGPRAAVR